MAPALVAIVIVGLAVPVILLCLRLVGQIAEDNGEDKVRWQLMMLPLGIFGPIVAKAFLERDGRGGGGFA